MIRRRHLHFLPVIIWNFFDSKPDTHLLTKIFLVKLLIIIATFSAVLYLKNYIQHRKLDEKYFMEYILAF